MVLEMLSMFLLVGLFTELGFVFLFVVAFVFGLEDARDELETDVFRVR